MGMWGFTEESRRRIEATRPRMYYNTRKPLKPTAIEFDEEKQEYVLTFPISVGFMVTTDPLHVCMGRLMSRRMRRWMFARVAGEVA